jgi:pimeloyl-ACP methyl ester carboxylesterase
MKFSHLYLHGGPGFNSFSEEALLAPALSGRGLNTYFWNEPSRSRPQGDPFNPERAYTGLVQSIASKVDELATVHSPITLIAHSFAVHPAIDVARKMPKHIGKMIFLTPSLDLLATYRNVLDAAQTDLKRLGHPENGKLQALNGLICSFFDPPMREAFQIAAQDPELILNYWKNQARMGEYLAIWMAHGVHIDAESFFSVLGELSSRADSFPGSEAVQIPVTAVFGRHDKIERQSDDEPFLRKLFPNLQVERFEDSAHYPHIEETDRFMQLL